MDGDMKDSGKNGGAMKILRVFTGPDGRSHFDEVVVELSLQNAMGNMSELQAVKGVVFRTTPADYEFDFHNAPCRQYVVNLQGTLEMEAGDGTKRRLGPGEILLGEDTTGEGHITRAVDGPGRSLFIPLE